VDASCPGNQGIGCVDRVATSLKIGLVAAGAARGLSGCLQELQPVKERRCGFAFLRAQAVLNLGDVDTGGTERMTVCQ
jgi:hypothetical protein